MDLKELERKLRKAKGLAKMGGLAWGFVGVLSVLYSLIYGNWVVLINVVAIICPLATLPLVMALLILLKQIPEMMEVIQEAEKARRNTKVQQEFGDLEFIDLSSVDV